VSPGRAEGLAHGKDVPNLSDIKNAHLQDHVKDLGKTCPLIQYWCSGPVLHLGKNAYKRSRVIGAHEVFRYIFQAESELI
jgi:hypothetical protein